MKNFLLKKILFSIFIVSFSLLFITNVFADTADIPDLIKKTELKKLDSKTIETIIKKQKESIYLNSKINNITTLNSAPPLSYLETFAAISSDYPTYEYFSENQVSSLQNHGGNEMYIVTIELGYGYSRFARMNSNLLSSLQYESIDYNNDSIVDGWYYWWNANGYNSGNFTYQNTSTNYPWNTMSDSLYIYTRVEQFLYF